MDIDNADLMQSATTDSETPDEPNVPTLKSICVKVIGMHLSSIDSFGSMPWHIIKPVLEDKRCTPEILRRLENQSPHLKEQDQDVWKKFFFEKYPEQLDARHSGEFAGIEDWRRLYDDYARKDEDKLANAALRMREATERKAAEKRERELQRTDKAPPSKRGRWGDPSSARPKSLLEKARSQTMKATAAYRMGPSYNSISSPASSSLTRGSVAVKPPAVARRPSTTSTISNTSGSTAVSNVSSISSSAAVLPSRIRPTVPLPSPSKSSATASRSTRPVPSYTSTSRGRPQTPARSVTLPNSRTPSFPPTATSSITQSRFETSSLSSVKPSISSTSVYSHSPHTSMADLILSRSGTAGSRN